MTNDKVTPIYGHRKRTKFGNSYRKSTRLKSVNIINSVHCESKHKLRQQANKKNNWATTCCLEVLCSTLKTSHYHVMFVILLFSCGFTHGTTASLDKKTVNTNDLFVSSSQSAFLTMSVPIYDSKTETDIPKGYTLVPHSMFDVSKHILPSFIRTNTYISYTVQISDTDFNDVTSEEVLSKLHDDSDLLASQSLISAYDSRYTSMFIPKSHSITDVTRTTTSFDVESNTMPSNDIPNTINKVSGIHLASSTSAFTTAEIIPTRTLKENEQNNSNETDKTFVISTSERTNSISKLDNENITSMKKLHGFVTPSRLSIEYKNNSSVENSMDAPQSDTVFSLDLLTQITITKGKQSEVNHISKTQEGILHTKSVAHTEKTLLGETSSQIAPSYGSKQTKAFIELDTSITQIFSHVESMLSPYSYKSVIVTSSPTIQTHHGDNIDQQTFTIMTDSIVDMNTPKITTLEMTLPTPSKPESQNEETESDAETYFVVKGSEDSHFNSLTDLTSHLCHTETDESSLLGSNSDSSLQSMMFHSKEGSIQVSSISKSFKSTEDYSHNIIMTDSPLNSFGTNTVDLISASYSYALLEMRSESGELLISQIGYSQVAKPTLLYVTTSTLSTFYNTIVLEETEDHNASSLNITPRSVTSSMSPPTSLANVFDIFPSSASSDESRTDHKLQTKDENTYVESQTTSPSYRANTVLTATQTHKPFDVSTQQSVSEFDIETPYLVTGVSDRVHSSDFDQNNSPIDIKSSLLLTPSVHEDYTTSSNDSLIKDSVTLKEIYPSHYITFTDQNDNALQTQHISSSYQHYHDVFESSEIHLTFDGSLTVLSKSTFATSKSDNIKQSSTIPFMSTDVISHTALEQEMSKFYSDLNLHSIVDSTYIVSLDGSNTRTSPTAVLPDLISNDIRTSKVYDSIDRNSKFRFSTHTGQMSDQQASSSNKIPDSEHFLNEQMSLTYTKISHGDHATTSIASAPTRKSLFQEPMSPSRDVSINFAGNSNVHNQYSMTSSSIPLLKSTLLETRLTPDLRYSTTEIFSEPSVGGTYAKLGTSPFIDNQIESSFLDSNSFGVHSSNRVSKSTSIELSLGGIDGTFNTAADGSTSYLNKQTYTISPFKTIYPGFTSQFTYSTHTISIISRHNHQYTDSDKVPSFIDQFTVTTQTKSPLITASYLFEADPSLDLLSSIRPSFSGISTTIDSRISSLELDFQTALQTQETEMSPTMASDYTIDLSLQFHNSFESDKYETIQNSKITFLSSNMEFPVSTEIQESIVSAIELPSIDQFKTTIIESETDKIYKNITTMLSSTAKYPTDSVKPSDKLDQEYTSVLSDKPMNSLTSHESSDKLKFDTRIQVSASLSTYSYTTPLASSNYITISVERVESHSLDSSTDNTLYTSMFTQDKNTTGSPESAITMPAGSHTTPTSQIGNIDVQSSYYTSEKAEHSITSISSNVYSKSGSDSRGSELSLLPTSVVFKSDNSMSTEIFSKEITDFVLSSIDSQRKSSTYEADSSSHGMSLISLTKLHVSPNTATVNTERVSFQLTSQEVVTTIERTDLFGGKSSLTFHNSEDSQAHYSPNSNIESSFSAILLIPSSFEKFSFVHSTTHVGTHSVSVINTIFVSGSDNPTDSISIRPMSRLSSQSPFTETSVASSSRIHRGEAFTVLHTALSNDPSELQPSTIATSQSVANVTNDQALKNIIASDLTISLTPNESSVLTANISLPLIPTESIFKSESLSVKSLTFGELITSSTARELGTSSMLFATRSTSILFSDQINTEQSLNDIKTGSTSITMDSASIDHSSEIRTQKHSNSKSDTGSVVLISELSTDSNTGYELESTLYPDTISSPDISVMFSSYPYLFPSIRRNSLSQSGLASIPAQTSRSNNEEPTPESATFVSLSENVNSLSNTDISTIASTEDAGSAIFQPWLRSSYGTPLISVTIVSAYVPNESNNELLKSSYTLSSRSSSKMQSNYVPTDISSDDGYSGSESGGATVQRDFISTHDLGSAEFFSESSVDVTESDLRFSVQTDTTFTQFFSEMKSQNYFDSDTLLKKDTVSHFVQPSSLDTTISFTNLPASIPSMFQVSMERAYSSEFLINDFTSTMSIFHSASMADVFTTSSTDNPAFLSMTGPTSNVTRTSSFLPHKVPNSKSIYDVKTSVREESSAITLITSYGTILPEYLNSAVTHTGDYIAKSSKKSDIMQTTSMYSSPYSTGTIFTPNDSPITHSSSYLKTSSSRERTLSISEGSISAEHLITSSNVYTIYDPERYTSSGFSYNTMLFDMSDSITSPIDDLSTLSASSRLIMFSSMPHQSPNTNTDRVTVIHSTLASDNLTFLQESNHLSSTARASSYLPGYIDFSFDSSIFDTSDSILSSSSELSTISTIRDPTISSSSQPFDTGYSMGKIVSFMPSASVSTYETKWPLSASSYNGLPALSTVRNGMIASIQRFISGYGLDNTEISLMSARDTSFDEKLAETVTITPFLSHLQTLYESDNIANSRTSHYDNSYDSMFIGMSDSTSTISSNYIMSTLSPIRDSARFSSGKHFGSGYNFDSKMKFVTSTEDLSYHITLTDMIAPTGFSTFDNEMSTSILSDVPSSIYRPIYNVTASTSISSYHTYVTDIITPTPSGTFDDGITTFTTFDASSSIYPSKYDQTAFASDSNFHTKLIDIITPTPSITFDDGMTTFITSDVSSSVYTPIYNVTSSTRDSSYHTILRDMITPTPSITFDFGISTFTTSYVHLSMYPPTYNVTSSTRVPRYGTKLTDIITSTTSSAFDNGMTAFTMVTTSDVSSAMYPSLYDKQTSTNISSYDTKLTDIITPAPTSTFDDEMSTFTTPDVSASMHPSIYAHTSSTRDSSYHTKLTYIATPNPSDYGMTSFILSDVPSAIYSPIYNVTASTRDTSYHTKLTDIITPTTSSMFDSGVTTFATSDVPSSIKPPIHNVTASTHDSSYNTKLVDIITPTTFSTFDSGVSMFTTSGVPPSVYPPIYDMQISTSISSYNTTLADIVTATPSSTFDDQTSTLTTSDLSSSIYPPIHNVTTSTRDSSYHSIMTDIVTFDDGITTLTTSSVYTTVASKSESSYHIKMTDKVTPTPSKTFDHEMTTFTTSWVHSSIYSSIYDVTVSSPDSSYHTKFTDIVTTTPFSTFDDGVATFTTSNVHSSTYPSINNMAASTRDSSYHSMVTDIIVPTVSSSFGDGMSTFTTPDVSTSMYTSIYDQSASTLDSSYHSMVTYIVTPNLSSASDYGMTTFILSDVPSAIYSPIYNVTASTRDTSYHTKLTNIITPTTSSMFDSGVTTFATSDVPSSIEPPTHIMTTSTHGSSYNTKIMDIITPTTFSTFDSGVSMFTTSGVPPSVYPPIYDTQISTSISSYNTTLVDIVTATPSSTFEDQTSTLTTSDMSLSIYPPIHNVATSTRDSSYHSIMTDIVTFDDGITTLTTSRVHSSIKPSVYTTVASKFESIYHIKMTDKVTPTPFSTLDYGMTTFTTSDVSSSIYPPIYDQTASTSDSSYHSMVTDIVTPTVSSTFTDGMSKFTTSDVSSSIYPPIYDQTASTSDSSYHSMVTDIVTPTVSSTFTDGMSKFTTSDVSSSIYPPIYDQTASTSDSSYHSMVTDIVTPTVSSTFTDGMSKFTTSVVSSSMYPSIYDQSASTLDSSYHSTETYITTPNLSSSFDGGMSTFTTFGVSSSIYIPVYDMATSASSSGYHTTFTDIITPSSTFEEGISTSTQFVVSSSVYPLIYNRTTLLTLTLQMKPSTNVNDPNVVEELEMGLLLCYEEGATKGLQTDSFRKRRQVDNIGENDAKVTSVTRRNDEPSYVDVQFYVTEDGVPLQSDDVEDMLDQLSLVELSAYLGYPVTSRPRAVTKVTTDDVDDDDTTVPLLVIVPIVGLLVALIVVVMVIYCCRKRYHGNQGSFVPSLTLKKPTLEEMDLMIDMERGEVVSRKSNTSTLATKPSTNTNTLSTALQRLQETGAEKVTEMPLRLNTYQYFQRSFSQICSPHDRLERLKSLGLNVTEIHTKTLYQIVEAPSNSENVAERQTVQSEIGAIECPMTRSQLGVTDRPIIQSQLGGDLQNSTFDKKEDHFPFSSIDDKEPIFELSSSESNPNANEDQTLLQLDREEKLWNKVTFMANDGYVSDSSPRSKKLDRLKRADENTRRKDGYNFSKVGLNTNSSREKNTRTKKKHTRHKRDNVRQRYPENLKLANVLDVHSYVNKILENPESTVIQNQKYKGDNSYIDTDTDSVYLPSVTGHSYNTDRDSYLHSDLDQQSELDDWNNSFNNNRHASDLQYRRSKQRLAYLDDQVEAVNPVMYRYFEPTERFYNADRDNNYRDGSEYAGFEFDSVNFSTNYRPEQANKSQYQQLSPVHPSSSYRQDFITGQPYKNFSQRNAQMEMAEPIVQYPEPSDPSALEHVTKMGRVGSKGVATYKPRFRPIPFQEHRATPMSTLESEQVQKREQESINRTPQLIQPYEPYEEMKLGRNMRAVPRGGVRAVTSTNMQLDNDASEPLLSTNPPSNIVVDYLANTSSVTPFSAQSRHGARQPSHIQPSPRSVVSPQHPSQDLIEMLNRNQSMNITRFEEQQRLIEERKHEEDRRAQEQIREQERREEEERKREKDEIDRLERERQDEEWSRQGEIRRMREQREEEYRLEIERKNQEELERKNREIQEERLRQMNMEADKQHERDIQTKNELLRDSFALSPPPQISKDLNNTGMNQQREKTSEPGSSLPFIPHSGSLNYGTETPGSTLTTKTDTFHGKTEDSKFDKQETVDEVQDIDEDFEVEQASDSDSDEFNHF